MAAFEGIPPVTKPGVIPQHHVPGTPLVGVNEFGTGHHAGQLGDQCACLLIIHSFDPESGAYVQI